MPVVEYSPVGKEVVFLNCDNPFEQKGLAHTRTQCPVKVAEPLAWTSAKPGVPFLDLVTVAGENGSELTIDGSNRIRSFKDAIGRQFDFAYDARTNELNRLTENGLTAKAVWVRQADSDGRYGDSWLNGAAGMEWKGTIGIDQSGLSMTNSASSTRYSPCGTKTVEQYLQKKLLYREQQDAFGNVSLEDSSAKTISYRFADGRSALRNLIDGSLLGYDRQGNLTVMQDASGKKFEFADYDGCGKPQSVLNERGRWDLIGDQIWRNEESGRFWYGTVQVNPAGAYTYIDTSGKVSSRFSNGCCVETYGGIRTITDVTGKRSRQYLDGHEFLEPPLAASPRWVIKDGVTVACNLRLQSGKLISDYAEDQKFARLSLQPHCPVAAFQAGKVVFSTRRPELHDQRKHSVIGLSEQDLTAILKFQNISEAKNMVIVQCYDRENRALRYELYAGLEQANVVVGDRVQSGQPIGRLSEDATLNFAVRRNSISGANVEVLMAAENSPGS